MSLAVLVGRTHRWEVVAETKHLKNLLICSNSAGCATWLPYSQSPQCSPRNALCEINSCVHLEAGWAWSGSIHQSVHQQPGPISPTPLSAPVSPSLGNSSDQQPGLKRRPSRESDLFRKLVVSVGKVGDISHSFCLSACLPRECNRRQCATGPWSTAPGTFIPFLFPAAVIHEPQPAASWENYIWRFTKIIFSFKKRREATRVWFCLKIYDEHYSKVCNISISPKLQ